MSHDINALKHLASIYSYKKTGVERLFQQQQTVVEKSRAELDEVTGSVNHIKEKLAGNAAYMQEELVFSDASRIVKAQKYRTLLEYDLEREEYYLLVATEDLTQQMQELNRRRVEIEKFKEKIEKVKSMLSRARIMRRTLLELQQEDDFVPCLQAEGLSHG